MPHRFVMGNATSVLVLATLKCHAGHVMGEATSVRDGQCHIDSRACNTLGVTWALGLTGKAAALLGLPHQFVCAPGSFARRIARRHQRSWPATSVCLRAWYALPGACLATPTKSVRSRRCPTTTPALRADSIAAPRISATPPHA